MERFKVISGTPESVEATLNTIDETHFIDVKGISSVIGITTVLVQLSKKY